MKKITLISFATAFFMLGSFSSLFGQAGIRVDGAATRIVASGAPFIVLNNMGYANNASNTMFAAGNSNVVFTGNANVSISSTGSFSTTFYNNQINKTGGAEIDVVSNNITLTTSNILTMTSGNVDMNTNLGSTWELGTSTANLGTLTRTAGHFYNGFFRRWYSAATPGSDVAQWDIPLGMNATSYNYARVFYPAATTGGSLRTRFVPVPTFYNGLPMTDNTNIAACGTAVNINNYANEGYWEVQAGGGIDLASAYTVKLCYANFSAATSEQCLRIIKSENLTSWMQEGTHGTVDATFDWVTRTGQTGYSLFTVGGDIIPNPLPVELAGFNAKCSGNGIDVEWRTASETNNSHFVIERSNNLMFWETVAVVQSQNGNSNQVQDYDLLDAQHYGTYYYRLTQFDNNGDQKTYDPVVVSCQGENTGPSIINSYSTDGQVTVVVFAPGNVDFTLGLYDLHGKKISTQNGMLVAGNNTLTLDANLLRDAFYVVNVQAGDKSLSKKIFVK